MPPDCHRFRQPTLPLIVFTDLDGSLLDHHSYSFAPALSALQRLRELRIPLIPVSSKTLAEVAELRRELDNPHPFIVENGAALVIPQGYFPQPLGEALQPGFEILLFSLPYAQLRTQLQAWRDHYGFMLSGFGDWTQQQISAQTGLDAQSAARASQRLGSEPFIWEDSAAALRQFEQLASDAGLRVVRGGRFYHLLGQTDKARAAHHLLQAYRQQCRFYPRSIALGDSANDLLLLHMADQAVVIKQTAGQHMPYAAENPVLFTDAAGPEGWCSAIHTLLDNQVNLHV